MTRLKMVTLKLPEEMVKAIDELIRAGRYATRSEFIRAAIREKLEEELRRIGSESGRVSNSPV
jgi:Arc/MetJ-type ribon-helix-helix transcriptional regulator